MPELVEIELERRGMEQALGRVVAGVLAPDPWFLKGGLDAAAARDALVGRTLVGARRRGKLLMVDLDDGGVLGLRFGMTGRLFVDDRPAVEELEYSSNRALPAWDRFALRLTDGGTMRLNDPRRLGGVLLDPDEDLLGPDGLSITPAQVAAALAGSDAPLKARLMDQTRVAGVGNLTADEALWRAGLDPARPARSLDAREVRRLHRQLRATFEVFLERGGSHTGDLQAERHSNGVCPKDGAPLVRRTVGGRTTYSCPVHQR
jgi:formamidopyrimidine-DNA glycosylase